MFFYQLNFKWITEYVEYPQHLEMKKQSFKWPMSQRESHKGIEKIIWIVNSNKTEDATYKYLENVFKYEKKLFKNQVKWIVTWSSRVKWDNIVKISISSKVICRFSVIPIVIPEGFFFFLSLHVWKLKAYLESQRK